MRTAMVMILLGLLCLQGLLSEADAQPAGSRNYFVKQDTILILATKRWVDSLVAAGGVVAGAMTGDAILDSLNAENRTATNRWAFSQTATFDDSMLVDNAIILGDDTPEQDEPGTIIFWPTGTNRGQNDKVVFRARPYGDATRYYYFPPTAGPDTLAVLSAVRTLITQSNVTGDRVMDSLNLERRTFTDTVGVHEPLILGDANTEQDQPGHLIMYPMGNRGTSDIVHLRAIKTGDAARYYYIPATTGPDTLAVLSAVRSLIALGANNGLKYVPSVGHLAQWKAADSLGANINVYFQTSTSSNDMVLSYGDIWKPIKLWFEQPYASGYIGLNNAGKLEFNDEDGATYTLAQLAASGGGTGTVDGSGLANRLAYWTDSNTLTSFPYMLWGADYVSFRNSTNTGPMTIYIANKEEEVYTGIDASGNMIFYDVNAGSKTLSELAEGTGGSATNFGALTDADTTNKQEFTTFAFDEEYAVWRQRPMIPHTVDGMRYFLASQDADSAISLPDYNSLWQEDDTAKVNNFKVDTQLIFPDGSTQTSAAGSSVSDAGYSSAWNGDDATSPSKNAIWDKVSVIVDNTAYNATAWNGADTTAPSKNAVRDAIEALSLAGGADGQNADSIMDAPVDTLLHQACEGDLMQYDGTKWTLRDPVKYIDQIDEFTHDHYTTGMRGELGWWRGGTNLMDFNSTTTAEANHPGTAYISSTANTGIHVMSLKSTPSSTSAYPAWQWGDLTSLTIIVKATSSSTDHKVRIGVMDDLFDDTPDVGMYLERDAAETNWRFVSKATADSEVRTDLGVSYGTTWHKFEMRIDADSLRCFVDGVQKANHALSAAPGSTDNMEVGFVINPTSPVARGLYIDFWRHKLEVTR